VHNRSIVPKNSSAVEIIYLAMNVWILIGKKTLPYLPKKVFAEALTSAWKVATGAAAPIRGKLSEFAAIALTVLVVMENFAATTWRKNSFAFARVTFTH